MSFDINVIINQWQDIVSGGIVTIIIWILSTIAGAILGFLVAVARRYGGGVVDKLIGFLVAVLRGTPFLIQIFLVYYGGPFVGLSLDPIPAGLLGLSIYASAYYS
jgi:polar amino acid transport system permease protein